MFYELKENYIFHVYGYPKILCLACFIYKLQNSGRLNLTCNVHNVLRTLTLVVSMMACLYQSLHYGKLKLSLPQHKRKIYFQINSKYSRFIILDTKFQGQQQQKQMDLYIKNLQINPEKASETCLSSTSPYPEVTTWLKKTFFLFLFTFSIQNSMKQFLKFKMQI